MLPVFKLMQQLGSVTEAEMFRTFNMGAGMVIVTAKDDVESIKTHLETAGERVYEIGRVTAGNGEVKLI